MKMERRDISQSGEPWACQAADRINAACRGWIERDLSRQIAEFGGVGDISRLYPMFETDWRLLGITCVRSRHFNTGARIWFNVRSIRSGHPDRFGARENHDAVVVDIHLFAGPGELNEEQYAGDANAGRLKRAKSIVAAVNGAVDLTSTGLVSPEGGPLEFRIGDFVLGHGLTGDLDADVGVIVSSIRPAVGAFLTYKCLERLLEEWCTRENVRLEALLALPENRDFSPGSFSMSVKRKIIRA